MNALDLNCVQNTLRFITEPIDDFLRDGFYMEPEYQDKEIAPVAIRRVVRAAAREAKRPFIHIIHHSSNYGTDPTTGVYGRLKSKDRPWVAASLTVPKRKYLVPLVSPLLLASDSKQVKLVKGENNGTVWQFHIKNKALLDYFLETMKNDPDIRNALGLASRVTSKGNKKVGLGLEGG